MNKDGPELVVVGHDVRKRFGPSDYGQVTQLVRVPDVKAGS